MLCHRCQKLPAEALRSWTRLPETGGGSGTEVPVRLADLFCENCEATLPLPDPSASVLERLAQLARFGFGEGQAILARASPARPGDSEA